MQRIERYGVIALVFLLVTILAVSLWGEGQGKEMLSTVKDKASGMTHLLAKKAETTPRTEPADRGGAQPTRSAAERNLPLGGSREATPPKRGGRKGGLRHEESLKDAFVELGPRTPAEPVPTPASPRSTTPQTPTAPPPVIAATPQQRSAPVHERGGGGPVVQGTRTYVVRAGDTLGEIAQRELGTFKRWTEIQRLNGGLDPAKLRSGMKLKLPAGGQAVAAAQPAPARPSAPAPAPGGSYVVRKGDSLSVISQRVLGTATRWREIVALNPGLDANRLAVGTRIVLPADGRAPALRGDRVVVLTSAERGSRVR